MQQQMCSSHLPNETIFGRRLNNIAWPIRYYWAKHFPIVITERDEQVGVAAIDFERVFVYSDLIRFDDDVLFCILAHEWAHRMVSPKSREIQQRITRSVSEALEIDAQLAGFISGIAIELIVDRANLDIEAWSSRYAKGFIEIFTSFVQQLDKAGKPPEGNRDAKGMREMMLALRMANVSAGALPERIRHMEQKARDLTSVLFASWQGSEDLLDSDHIEKITRFSAAFYRWFPKSLLKQQRLCLLLLHTLYRQIGNILASLPANGPLPAEGVSHSTIEGDAYHSRFDLSLTRRITRYLMRQSRKHRQVPSLWQIGQPLNRLDFKRSFRHAPELIPGVTTRRQRDGRHLLPNKPGKRLKLCMVVDDSASMSGQEAAYARSICEGINRFAAQQDLHIGLITFGSDIDVSLKPQRRYQSLTRSLARLDGGLGGTNLLPALQRLSAFIRDDRDITHALLITDALFSDWKSCQRVMADIHASIKIVTLLIHTEPQEHLLTYIKRHRSRMHCFHIDPSQPFSVAVLEEIV